MRKGELGVENLNKVLQAYMNPRMDGKNEHEFHGVIFRENDKVMQIKIIIRLNGRGKTALVMYMRKEQACSMVTPA